MISGNVGSDVGDWDGMSDGIVSLVLLFAPGGGMKKVKGANVLGRNDGRKLGIFEGASEDVTFVGVRDGAFVGKPC
jgi:hypothetical protein